MCRIYKLFNKKYEYEKHRFFIELDGKSFTYCPDFYFPDRKVFYEIKGHAKSSAQWNCLCKSCIKNRAIMKIVCKKYDIKVTIIGNEEYKKIRKRFREKIINWEN